MSHARGEDGAIQVVEAILVAVLVGSALIFFALSQRPSVPPAGPTTDLAQVATDTLVILQGSDPGGATDQLMLYVRDLLPGSSTTCPTAAHDAKQDIEGLLPEGMQFRLQASSASASTVLLTCSTTRDPAGGAQAGVAYVVDSDAPETLYRVELVVWDVF